MWTNLDGLEASTTHPEHSFSLENERLLRVRLANEQAWSKHGAMVAYTGQVEFDYQGSGSLGKFVKKSLTGEGTKLATFRGTGDVYLADQGRHVFLVYLQGEGITLNGPSLLAFSQGIEWDIKRIKGAGGIAGAGLFNTELQGTGWVALTARSRPIKFDVQTTPVIVDPNAAVAWTTSVQHEMRSSFSAGNLIGRGSGESLQMACWGQGWILVQPFEEIGVLGQS